MGTPSASAPLWPGSRYTVQDRDRAVRRGLEYMYEFAHQPAWFREWGHDLLGAFYNIANTSSDTTLRRMAGQMGRERAAEWRRLYPAAVLADTGAGGLMDLIWGDDAATRLGVPDAHFSAGLKRAAARFTVVDFLGFDPAVEPPPDDLPRSCPKCGRDNPRGSKVCQADGTQLEIYNRYEVFQDALIGTYSCDQAGIPLGGRQYRDVFKWLPAMRPWPARRAENDRLYFGGIYAITHVVYTYNSYSQYRLSRDCFPTEFQHLKDNLEQAVSDKDPETMGEYLDSLRSFGMGFQDGLIRSGFDYLLAAQNPDGSWGDPKDPDPYGRYHPTWTAVDGLRDYRWPVVLPCPQFPPPPRAR